MSAEDMIVPVFERRHPGWHERGTWYSIGRRVSTEMTLDPITFYYQFAP